MAKNNFHPSTEQLEAALRQACELVEAYKGCPEGKWREDCVEVEDSAVCVNCWVEEFLRKTH
jgi:hypothetical protein